MGILLQLVLQEYYEKYQGRRSSPDLLIHPSLSQLYQLKTADGLFPELPERFMSPLVKNTDLANGCKHLNIDIAEAEVTQAEVEALNSPRRTRKLTLNLRKTKETSPEHTKRILQ